MQLQPKPEGKPDTETLAGEFKELLPTAKSQKEVAEAVRPYADFERDFRTRGAQAFVDAAAQRGVHLADLSNPQHRLHVAAEFYGQPDRAHQLVEQVVQQRVSEVVQQHVAQAVEQVQQANVQEAMAQVARGRSDFDQLRQSMAEIIQSPRWRERDGEFDSRRAAACVRHREARTCPPWSRQEPDGPRSRYYRGQALFGGGVLDKPWTQEQREEMARLLRADLPSLFQLGAQVADAISPPTDKQRDDIVAGIDRATDALTAGAITVEDGVAEIGRLLADHAQRLAVAMWERAHGPNRTVH